MKILIIHGPNLNLLGVREIQNYGKTSLKTINKILKKKSKKMKINLNIFQSNKEHQIINKIHQAQNIENFIIINPSGLTHTSIIIRDALLSVSIPFIEIHISNIYKREKFRQNSFFSDIAVGVISGLGVYGYFLSLIAAKKYLQKNKFIYK